MCSSDLATQFFWFRTNKKTGLQVQKFRKSKRTSAGTVGHFTWSKFKELVNDEVDPTISKEFKDAYRRAVTG